MSGTGGIAAEIFSLDGRREVERQQIAKADHIIAS
jgi:hypothetical protein